MLIKVKALGHRKKLLNRLSRQAPFDSLIDFYRGLKLIPNYCEFNKGIFFGGCSLLDDQHLVLVEAKPGFGHCCVSLLSEKTISSRFE